MGANAVQVLPGIAMGILMGTVSQTDSATILAARSLSDLTQSLVVYTLLGGVASALGTLGAQSVGANQLAQLCLYAQAAAIAYAYVLPPLTVISLNGAALLELLGQDTSLTQLAGLFMRIDAVATPLLFAGMVAQCVLSSQRIVAPLVFVPLVAAAVSLPLAYVLGFYTQLNYVGVAIANVVNSAVNTALLLLFAWRSPACQNDWPGWQWHEAHALLVRLWPLGVASLAMVIMVQVGFNAQSFISGYLPNAAQSIASITIVDSIFTMTAIPMSAIDGSGAIRVGNALGANDPIRARIGGTISVTSTALVGILAIIIGAFIAGGFARVSTSDEATADAAASLFYAMMLSVPLTGWMFGSQGVLRACGKQSVIATLTFLCLIVLGSPLGYVLGVTYGLGTAGVWYGKIVGLLVYDVATTVYLMRLDWRKVTQDASENTHIHERKASIA
jgi:multidrug resistance protein, MATE family